MDYERTPEARNEIVIKDLVKNFGDVKAVNGLTLDVRKGEMFGFLGPNGAGKTTTISCFVACWSPPPDRPRSPALISGKNPRK